MLDSRAMAKEKPVKPSDARKPVNSAAPEAPASESKTDKIDSRLSIPFDADGQILLENMRQESKDRLKKLLNDPLLGSKMGIMGPEMPISGASLPPEFMFPLVHGLSIFEMLLVQQVTKAPRELIEQVVPYTREETQMLAPALSKVLSKYSGSFLTKYGDEAALALLLVSMTTQKIAAVKDAMARQPRPAPVVVPIRPVSEGPEDPQ